jgi:hypothetical protein
VDAFFTVAEARSDRWRTLVKAANACLAELRQWEDFLPTRAFLSVGSGNDG